MGPEKSQVVESDLPESPDRADGAFPTEDGGKYFGSSSPIHTSTATLSSVPIGLISSAETGTLMWC